MADFESLYAKAVEDGTLPGYALLAGDKAGKLISTVTVTEKEAHMAAGNTLYSDAKGVTSLREGSKLPFQMDTICSLASMTKLMTAVAAMQCVQAGLTTLDGDVSKHLPSIGKYGILTGFDDEKNEAITVANKTPITLR
jgi:CubicO group peptidase (beta-lactamase class C family)